MKDVSAGADMPFSSYQAYESGAKVPTAGKLEKLADFFGITIDELIGRSDIDHVRCVSDNYELSEDERQFLQDFLDLPKEQRANFVDGMQAFQMISRSPPELYEETTLGEIEDRIARQDGEKSKSNAG